MSPLRRALLVLVLAMAPNAQATALDSSAPAPLSADEVVELRAAYKAGLAHSKGERYDEAIAAFRGCLKTYGERLSHNTRLKLRYVTAICFYRSGRARSAFPIIRKCKEMAPLHPKIQQTYAMIEKAIKTDNPDDPDASPSPGPIAIGSPSPSPSPSGPPPPSLAESKAAFERARDAYPGVVRLIDTSQDYVKQLDAVIADMDVARRGNYQLDRALFYGGAARVRRSEKGDASTAIEMLAESQKLAPAMATLVELGTAYGLEGDTEKETATYEQALLAKPADMPEAQLNVMLGDLHFKAAVAYDKSTGEDATRKTFEHAKASIRLNSANKPRFQNMLRNSKVAHELGVDIQEVLDLNEKGELTEEQVAEIAKKFQRKIGGPSPRPDTIKDLMQGKDVKDEITKLRQDPKALKDALNKLGLTPDRKQTP